MNSKNYEKIIESIFIDKEARKNKLGSSAYSNKLNSPYKLNRAKPP